MYNRKTDFICSQKQLFEISASHSWHLVLLIWKDCCWNYNYVLYGFVFTLSKFTTAAITFKVRFSVRGCSGKQCVTCDGIGKLFHVAVYQFKPLPLKELRFKVVNPTRCVNLCGRTKFSPKEKSSNYTVIRDERRLDVFRKVVVEWLQKSALYSFDLISIQ